MNDHDQLIAFLATLAALVLVFCAALLAASVSPDLMGKMEVFGLGTITGGLIGVLRIPVKTAGNSQADANLGTALDKLPPATTGTGPAVPLDDSAAVEIDGGDK